MSQFKFLKSEEKIFWFWINERHSIFLKKEALKKRPWTKDKILDTYKFTNPFRQLDRVTQEWVKRYTFLYGSGKHKAPQPGDILFHCVMFRLFNWPKTYDALFFEGIWYAKKNGPEHWSRSKALKILRKRQEAGEQIFTGAYIVPNLGLTTPKIEIICDALDAIWKERHEIATRIMRAKRMKVATEIMQEINSVGPFIAYEIVCDLRFTFILNHARDTMIWANPGPGAKRGIHRLLTGKPKIVGKKPDYQEAMKALLDRAPQKLKGYVKRCEWPFEMREIEHSLCEFDKYQRAKNGEGRPRSRYRETPVAWQKKQDARYAKKKMSVKQLLSAKAWMEPS